MSVSTEYFDYVYKTKNIVLDDLDKAIGKLSKLEKKQARLEALVEDNPSNKRLSRLDKINGKIEAKESEAQRLIRRFGVLDSVELPKDEVTFSIWEPIDGITGIQVTITDSPYDDSFVGGQNSSLSLSGSGKYTGNGWSAFGSRSSLIGDDFADGTQTFGFAGKHWNDRLDGSYPNVEASLLQGWTPRDDNNDYTPTFVTAVYTDGELQLA